MTACQGWVEGSIYSRKGGGRFDPCEAPAKYHVGAGTAPSNPDLDVCGTHVRRFKAMNESLWRTDDSIGRPRRDPFYAITELER